MAEKNEAHVRAEIKLRLGSRPDCLILSNPSGAGIVGRIEPFTPGSPKVTVWGPRWISFGLGSTPGRQGGAGFPDFIGIQTVTITPEMIGQEIGVFVAIEVKSDTGQPSPKQCDKIALLRSRGALAGTARTAEEAEAILYE